MIFRQTLKHVWNHRGLAWAVARQVWGGGDFKLVLIQSSHRFGLATSLPNLSESSLAGWAPVLGFAALTLGQFGAAQSPPAKLVSAKFCSSR